MHIFDNYTSSGVKPKFIDEYIEKERAAG